MLYDIGLKKLPKTSPRTVSRLESAGIISVGDLIETIPFRYEDYRSVIQIGSIAHHFLTQEEDIVENNLVSTGKVTIEGTIEKKTNIFTRRGFSMQKITVKDDSGQSTITWFNQPFLLRLFSEGSTIAISGAIKNNNGAIVLQPENYEVLVEGQSRIHTGRIVPIYSSIPGISTRTLREKMHAAVMLYGNMAEEILPKEIVENFTTKSMSAVFKNLHFPENIEVLKEVRERMSFNELFSIQLKTKLVRKEWEEKSIGEPMNKQKIIDVRSFIENLPYKLTNAQARSVEEILENMSGPHPMNRLLQGDVGSGKTIVAFAAAYFSFLNDKKVLYMAPTEILAQQHFKTMSALCELLPVENRPRLCLMTQSHKPSKDEFNEAGVVVGTHALLTSKHEFSEIGLVIIDEQHKFGVMQRGALKKRNIQSHMLSLTATPIPRTVLLSLYGELDVSIIDEFPKGRKEIKTYLAPEEKRLSAYTWMKKELDQKHQIFIVCPFIEQSESETLQSVKAATEEIKKIKSEFKNYSVELLHGKLKPDEKDSIMKLFSEGSLDILVSTPVVEVGIDVPKATVIVIEGAERFGLAQLHQLRGRVGRSNLQSHCVLFTTSTNEKAQKRLQFFSKTHDGFELARFDLSHRGGGNIFGTQQHGYSPIALETLLDTKIIEKVQRACDQFLDLNYSFKDFPYLTKRLAAFQYEAIAHN